MSSAYNRICIAIIVVVIVIIVIILLVIRRIKNGNPYTLANYLNFIIGDQRKQQNEREIRNHRRYLSSHDLEVNLNQTPSTLGLDGAVSHLIKRYRGFHLRQSETTESLQYQCPTPLFRTMSKKEAPEVTDSQFLNDPSKHKRIPWEYGSKKSSTVDQYPSTYGSVPSYCSAWATSHTVAANLNDDLMLNFNEVKNEILAVCQNYEGIPMIDIDDVQRSSFFKTAPNWKVIWIKFFDQWGPLADRMPTLKRIINQHPELILIHISVMDPGTILPRHEGISPAVVRYHLPIQVPPGQDVYLNLDNYKINWTVGEGFIFDDCLPHGVVMRPDINMKRVIIFADIPRTFDGPLASLYEMLCSYFHEHIRNNVQIERIKRKIVNHQNDQLSHN